MTISPQNTDMRSGNDQGRITVLHVFPTFNVGGSSVRTADLVNNLDKRFHHLIMSIDGQYGCMERVNEGANCTRLEFRYDKTATLHNISLLRRFMANAGVDVLVTYNWGSIEWGMANLFSGRPHVHIEDGFGPDEAVRLNPKRNFIRRLVFALGRTEVVLPSHVLSDIARTQWGVSAKRLNYIPNGIDCARFDRSPDQTVLQEFGLADKQLIGTVAVLRKEKNLGRLISAFAQLQREPAPVLVIIGDGPERPLLEAHASDLGVSERVVFTGRMSAPEHLLSALNIFALSSDTEQMPYSVLEAMAAAVPVVSVEVGDVRRMVSEPNQPMVSGMDEDILATNMQRLLSDPDLAKSIGTANQEFAQRTYAWQIMFETYDALFRSGLPR